MAEEPLIVPINAGISISGQDYLICPKCSWKCEKGGGLLSTIREKVEIFCLWCWVDSLEKSIPKMIENPDSEEKKSQQTSANNS